MAYVSLFARLILGAVFALSAGSKFSPARARAFASGIQRLAGIPARWSGLVGRATVLVEVAIAVLVTIPSTAAAGLWLSTATLLGFALVLLRAVRAGVSESCHCFGGSDQPVAGRHVARTALLLGAAAAGATSATAGGHSDLPAAGVALTVVVATVSVAAAVFLDDLASLFLDPQATAARPAHPARTAAS